MKQLLINGQEVTMDVNTYFPFTYKLSSLDDVNIINFPSTKSINLPRTLVNDEIFGHIAEVTRTNYSFADNKVGVSFNQIKKGQYELIDNNKTISKGIIRIVNVTKDEYEIELYDQAIELLETLEDKYLNELTIINPHTNQPINILVNHSGVKNMMNGDYGIVPILGDYDTNYKTNTIYGRDSDDGGKPIVKLTLPEELTPLQLRTFPAGDIPYAIKLTKVFDMIKNSKDNEVKNKVTFSNDVRNLVKDVHMLLGKPENSPIRTVTDNILPSEAFHNNSTTKMSKEQFSHFNRMTLTEEGVGFYRVSNGNYSIRLEFEFTITTKSAHTNNVIMRSVTGDTTTNSPVGTKLGDMFLETKYSYDATYDEPIKDVLPLILGENTFYKKIAGNKGQLKIYGTVVLNRNFFPKAESRSVSIHQQLQNFENRGFPHTLLTFTYPFNLGVDSYTVDSIIRPSAVRKPLEFTEYDMITSEKLLPSNMTIKDFILDLAKAYNLNITAKNNGLYVDVKKFKETSDVLLIDGTPEIDVGKVDFSKLIISPIAPDSQHVKEYEDKLKKDWASKVINTGYTIKRDTKEVDMPYGTSLPIIDYNFFAYNAYGEYLNGGYARYPTGDITGMDENELILGYINKVNEKVFLIDTVKEKDGTSVMTNERLTYFSGRWLFNTEVFAPQSDVDSFNTFLPYKIENGIIVESLEFNKPEYNFADFTDNEYSEETTLYDRFHKKMLIDKYDSNTHILTAKMFIDGLVDVEKIYNYKNSNYIISELVEYDPTEPDLYEVKLMRVNNINNYTNDDK